MTDLVSIVVPIYNVEQYLARCINSIINQTYRNLEIILVDDGSPDLSGKICDEFAEIDSRIKVIHKQNGGASSARNTGIDVSSGVYICFIDSDDYIKETYVEKLYDAITSTSSDIAVCNHYRQTKDNLYMKLPYSDMVKTDRDSDFFYYLCIDFNACVPWNKLFKASIIKDNSIRFLHGIFPGEDNIFCMEYASKAHCATYISDFLYFYVDSDTSICKKSEMISFYDNYKLQIPIYRNLMSYSPNINFKVCCKIRLFIISCCLLYDNKKYNLKNDVSSYKKNIRQNLFTFISYKFMSVKHKFRTLLMIVSPTVFDKIRTGYRLYESQKNVV